MNGVNANPDAQVGKEERDIWHKRLRLRKTSFSFPTDRNTVKEERSVAARGWKAAGKSKQRPQSLNTFTCSSCTDGVSFRPAELTMHFQIVHGGKGSPPVFPCDVCAFSSPAFASLQQHRMQHEGCLLACEICEDDVQRTLPQLTKHCQTRHALNGQYQCPKCKLSFREIKQFVCHLCRTANGNAPKNELFKHMAAACRQRWSRRNWRKQDNNLPQEFKCLLPKPEPRWTSQLLPFSAPGLMDDYGVLLDPEKTLEETQQYLERTGKNWPASFNGEQDLVPPHPSQANAKWSAGKDKLSGLMEKNNISVPPDCTTKVVRFKMVDGKKHLVLKVIPSNKQDASRDARAVLDRPGGIRSQVTPRSSSSVGKKQEGCAAQQDFLSSVVERIKSQENDGGGNQEPAAVHLQDKAFSESEENFTACQGDSGCHSDLTSDAGSLEERCSSRLLSTAFDELDQPKACSVSGFDCMSPSSGSPLKDLNECQSEDGGLLFHGNADECTNNTAPRERLVPVGQTESCRAPVDELPLTTVIHLLDEARADRTLSPRASSDEALRDFTRAGDANQRSEPVDASIFSDSNSSASVPATASLNRKRMGDASSADSPFSRSSVLFWEPAPRDAPATLRLIPHSSSQSVKIPRDRQPVIVLNHPDSDIPEVTNIMRVVHRHRGAVQRVLLSRKTLKALSESSCDAFRRDLVANCHASHRRREWPNGTVKERFSLKLRLKRVCGRKYTVVPTASESIVLQPTFKCWFCGRLFANQEAWVGHGQRHLMEATRGWNQLFSR